jgi:hypothetical protein
VRAEPAAYDDGLRDEVRRQLLAADGVLVWCNPIEGGRDRTLLDAMLREVAASGVLVSAHPDTILKIGTKQVLYDTRSLPFGSDTHVYRSLRQMREELPTRLAAGPRVLKQYRGQSGNGVWRVEAGDGFVSARHAQRGSSEQRLSMEGLFDLLTPYFAGDGRLIDQEWQPRIAEGMVRCYLVGSRVEGFGLQAINALHPTEAQPGPRLYHPPTLPAHQRLKQQLEREWLPEMQRLLDMETAALPLLWDCDFMLGAKDSSGNDRYVLCEINVSSVHPFPDSALAPLARATLARLLAR